VDARLSDLQQRTRLKEKKRGCEKEEKKKEIEEEKKERRKERVWGRTDASATD